MPDGSLRVIQIAGDGIEIHLKTRLQIHRDVIESSNMGSSADAGKYNVFIRNIQTGSWTHIGAFDTVEEADERIVGEASQNGANIGRWTIGGTGREASEVIV